MGLRSADRRKVPISGQSGLLGLRTQRTDTPNNMRAVPVTNGGNERVQSFPELHLHVYLQSHIEVNLKMAGKYLSL
jgi:hypothetical protein